MSSKRKEPDTSTHEDDHHSKKLAGKRNSEENIAAKKGILADPFSVLNKQCISSILSFLAGEGTRCIWRSQELGVFYYSIARVSKVWKTALDEVVTGLFTNIELELERRVTRDHGTTHYPGDIPATAEFFSKHGIQLKAVVAKHAEMKDRPQLLELFKNCNTSSVTRVKIRYNEELFAGPNYNSGQGVPISSDITAGFSDLTLQEMIAKECPNLESLVLPILITSTNSADYVCPRLFSMPSIRVLRVTTLYLDTYINPKRRIGQSWYRPDLLMNLVKNLKGLKELSVNDWETDNPTDQVYSLSSESLEKLYVVEMCPCRLSLNCPNLKLYTCKTDNWDFWRNNPDSAMNSIYQSVNRDSPNLPATCLVKIQRGVNRDPHHTKSLGEFVTQHQWRGRFDANRDLNRGIRIVNDYMIP